MKIPFSGLIGPVLAFAVRVNEYLDGLSSVPLKMVATAADLPNPTNFDRRQILIRSTGLTVTALDGTWRDSTGAPI